MNDEKRKEKTEKKRGRKGSIKEKIIQESRNT